MPAIRNAARSPHIEPNVPEPRRLSKTSGDISAVKLLQSDDQIDQPMPMPRHPVASLIQPLITNVRIVLFSAVPVVSTIAQHTHGWMKRSCPVDPSTNGQMHVA